MGKSTLNQTETYAHKWQLKNVSFEGETTHSRFYACQSDQFGAALLKILKPEGLASEKGGFELLARYSSPLAVELFQYNENAALMERLKGPRLLELIDDGHEEEALEIQLNVTRRLFDAAVQLTELKTFKCIMANSLNLEREDVPDWAAESVSRAQNLAQEVLHNRSNWCVLHGDLHPRNILKHDAEWRVIDARAIFGPPAFEYANIFINPWDRKDLIFRSGRMEHLIARTCGHLGCDRRTVISCAVANALYYAQLGFLKGKGRHPIKCINRLLELL